MAIKEALAEVSPKSSVDVLEADKDSALLIDKSTRIKAVVLEAMYSDPCIAYHSTVNIAAQYYGRDQLRFTYPQVRTLIDAARDMLMQRFWDNYPNAECAIMLDNDMAFPVGNDNPAWRGLIKTSRPILPRFAKVNVFERLLSHPLGLGIIGGTYYDRQYGTSIQCSAGVGSDQIPGFAKKFESGGLRGLQKMKWVGSGCIKIPRWVHRTLIENIDKFPGAEMAGKPPRYGFFNNHRHAQGEDVYYAVAAGQLGISTYLDTELRCWHRGEQWF